jgi:general secretion pathway protein B
MSYILDALQRADAERGRGNVPGLHARQLPTALEEAATARTGLRGPLVWGGLLVLVLAATVAGLWMWRSPASPSAPVVTATASQPAPAATPVASPTLPAAVPVVPAVPVAPVVSPAAPTAPIATPTAALAPSAPASVGAPPAPPATVQAAAVARTAPQPAPTAPPAASVTPVVVPASATPAPRAATAPAPTSPTGSSAAPAEAPLLSGLPEDLRRQIPALVITGVVHADNPAQRLLVVNNQVLTQDGQLGPDLMLETIGSRHSVFRFRGTRFRVANQ